MQYQNYETEIVHKYGVELTNWPLDTYALDRVSREVLYSIVDGLMNDTIVWRRLSDSELSARIDAWKAKEKANENTVKAKTSNKGSKKDKTRRGRKRARVSAEEVPSDADDDATPVSSEQSADTQLVSDLSADVRSASGDCSE